MDNTAAWLNKEPQSPTAEGFKALRTNLVFAAEEQDCRMILLVSPQEDRSAARFAANLGATMAFDSRKVLLVDGDLRTGALTSLLTQGKQSAGLSQWIASQKSLEEVTVPSGVSNMSLLPSGALCADPAALFSEKGAADALRSLRAQFDYIIVYAPNAEDYTDAVVLSRLVDGAVVLFAAEKTKLSAAQKCTAALEAVKAPILGAVLNYFR